MRTSVGRAFVPKPLRLLLVRLLPGDDRAEVVHEGLGVGRALDASQQFAPGVEHEVERNGAAAVLLHQFAARGLVRVVFGRHEPLVHELPDVLARKDLPLHHPARGTPAGIEVDEDQLALLDRHFAHGVRRFGLELHLRLRRARSECEHQQKK